MKTRMSKVKNILYGINKDNKHYKKKISKLESILIKIIQNETQKEKRLEKIKYQWVVGMLKVDLQLIDVLLIICLIESLEKREKNILRYDG